MAPTNLNNKFSTSKYFFAVSLFKFIHVAEYNVFATRNAYFGQWGRAAAVAGQVCQLAARAQSPLPLFARGSSATEREWYAMLKCL